MVSVPALKTPPPRFRPSLPVMLPDKVQLLAAPVPSLKIPPPSPQPDPLADRVQSLTVMIPWL